MNKLLRVTAICVAVTMLVLPLAYGQDKAAPPSPAQQDKVFQGQLTKVDVDAKSISVKGTGDMEMTFAYTDATQVVGERNVQGLASKTGTQLSVTYRDAGGKHTATKIETAPEKK
jgi:hypothetical protein